MYENSNQIPRIHVNHVFFKFQKKLEKEFYNDFFQHSTWYIRVALFLCLLLVAMFGILDNWIVPINKQYAWLIRYAILCPIILFIFFLSFFSLFKKIMQPVLNIGCFLVGLGFLGMIAIAQESEPGFKFYYVGLIQVLIAAHILFRLRFVHATIISWIIIILYEFVGINLNGMLSAPENIPIFLNNNFFIISSNVMGMIASFFIEYYIRNDFLLRKRIKYEEEQKMYHTKAELLKTQLERDYAQQAIHSIEQETDAGFRNIAHSIKNKHMIQEVMNKNIRANIKRLNAAIVHLENNLPSILNKSCHTVVSKYKEKILKYIQEKYPDIIPDLRNNGDQFPDTMGNQLIKAFKIRNERKINEFLVTGIIRSTEGVHNALADSYTNMVDILNYIYAIIAYQRGKAVDIIGNVFTELGRVYWHIARTYRIELSKYNIAFKYENNTGEDIHIRVYDFILEEDIIRNLFVNSFRALVEDDSDNTRIDKRIWIEVYIKSVDEKDQFYIIHFRDNGPGIKPEMKKEIFEGYSSKDREYIVSDIKTEVEHGVGLRTVKKRIEEAGGSIHEEGIYGEGADFVIILKRYKDGSADKKSNGISIREENEKKISASDNRSGLFSGHTLLIVDDSKIIADGLGSIFEDTGMKILYAYTIDEARNKIYAKYSKPEAILLDLDLGSQRGENLLLEMMGKNTSIPVIVVSGSDRVYDTERLKSLKAHSIFPKPVDEEKLFAHIKSILIDGNKGEIDEKSVAGQKTATKKLRENNDTGTTFMTEESDEREIPEIYRHKKILIVEDDKETREAIAQLFSGLTIQFAPNASEAKLKIMEFNPDVITLDLGLGKEDGRDVLIWMNLTGTIIPTVVVSAEIESDGDETAQELIKLGALRTFKKPFNENKLFEDVISLIK